MAYNIPWNEGTPIGASTPANTIDTELQNLKESISERIVQVIPDWDNDAIDPKTLGGYYGRLSLASAFSIAASATWSVVTWDNEDFDVGDVIDLGAQPTRLTVPAGGGGLIVLIAHINHQANAGGTKRGARIKKNGTVMTFDVRPLTPADDNFDACTIIDVAAAADFYTVEAIQDTGGANNLRGTDTGGTNYFSMHKIAI